MTRLILAFIILAGSILAGLHLSQSPGYVLIAINGWTVETTLWFALFALLIFFLIFHGILSLFQKPAQWRSRWRLYREKRQADKALALLHEKETRVLEKNLCLTTLQELEKTGSREDVDTFFHKLSRKLRNTPKLKEEYIQYLIHSGQEQTAEKILRKALKKAPTDMALIELYGTCHFNQKQIMFAESLLPKNDPSATLYLCLGRLCMHNQLWGKARDYLEKSIALNATPEAYQELAKLFESIDEKENAYIYYKQGLELM